MFIHILLTMKNFIVFFAILLTLSVNSCSDPDLVGKIPSTTLMTFDLGDNYDENIFATHNLSPYFSNFTTTADPEKRQITLWLHDNSDYDTYPENNQFVIYFGIYPSESYRLVVVVEKWPGGEIVQISDKTGFIDFKQTGSGSRGLEYLIDLSDKTMFQK